MPVRLGGSFVRLLSEVRPNQSKGTGVPEEVAIEATIKGLRIGSLASHLAREKPASM